MGNIDNYINRKPNGFDESTELLEKEVKKLKEINIDEIKAILHSAYPADFILSAINALEEEIKSRKQLYVK